MTAEAGHISGRWYADQAGNIHLNGAALYDANEAAVTPVRTAAAAQAAVTPTSAITGSDTVNAATVLASIQALETLVNALRTVLVNSGLAKGSA